MQRWRSAAKRGLAGVLYPLVPRAAKERVVQAMFQPARDHGLLARVARYHLDDEFAHSSEEDQAAASQRLWSGQAGSGWIEDRRSRYAKGLMRPFVADVRAPLMEMIMDVLREHPSCRTVIDLGTGPGQLLFDLAEVLSEDHELIGVDINSAAIEANAQRAIGRTGGPRLHFECAEAVAWVRRAPVTGPVLLCTTAILKFFPPRQVDALLSAIRERFTQGWVVICEEVVGGPEAPVGVYTGNCGFAHNYPAVFKDLGYRLQVCRVTDEDATAGGRPRFLYAAASFEGGGDGRDADG